MALSLSILRATAVITLVGFFLCLFFFQIGSGIEEMTAEYHRERLAREAQKAKKDPPDPDRLIQL